ncbi:hypothetical protein KAU32_00965 [bacterium]|nr:hypothetical protein [bacterium]
MILFGGKKKGKFAGGQFFSLVQKGKYKQALALIGEEEFRHLGDEPDVIFTYLAVYYLQNNELYEFDYPKAKLVALEKEWALTGDIEKVLGLDLYYYYNLKDKSYVNKIIDAFELIGDYKRAIDFFNSEIGTPKDAQSNNKLGFLLWELKDYKAALQSFKKSLVMQNDPLTYNSMGLIYNELGNQVLAKKYFKEGLKEFPDDITLLSNYGVLLFNLGEIEESNIVVEKLKSYNIGNSFLHAGIGKILPPEYEIDLEEELARHPKSPSIVLEIGKFMLRRGSLEKLITFIKDEMTRGNESPKILSLLSYAYFFSYEFSEAESAVLKSIEKFPDNITLLLTIIFLYINRGKFEKVLPILEKIKSVDPMYIEALFNVGMILENAGILTKAKLLFEWFVEVSDQESSKQVVELHLEVINSRLNLKEERGNEGIF